jgi:hypothetical protein
MGSECLQCHKPLFHDTMHICSDVPTIGTAEQHAAQLQRDDPKEEYEDAEFNKAGPLPNPQQEITAHYTYESNLPQPPHSGLKINRVVTDIELPCETCGEYVIYKPVTHKCEPA